jgi:hypothetical protein
MQFAMIMGLAALAAMQDVGTISPGGIEAIGPKQDDPRAMCNPGSEPNAMLSQGRVRLSTSSGMRPSPGGKLAIGPKQDDPRSPGVLARPGDDNDPKASGGQGGLAIGPKQDDPRSPGLLAIGPKQDDPRSPSTVARPGDDEDPQALAGKCGRAMP